MSGSNIKVAPNKPVSVGPEASVQLMGPGKDTETRVLVMDVDVNQWELIVTALKSDPQRPNRFAEAAKSIRSAVERIEANPYSVIIIRDDMPGFSFETLQGLKDVNAGGKIIVTSLEGSKHPEGADGHAIRPVTEKNTGQLLKLVGELEGPQKLKT